MPAEIPLHPVIVHTPIALLLFSALFAIVGRLFDRDWVRKASVLLLVFGFFGAIAANLSGNAAGEFAEEKQGVPERVVDEHEAAGRWVMFIAGGAVLAFAAASRLSGGPRKVLTVVAVLLQLNAAAVVLVAGYRGGKLVYEHAAGVSVGGTPVRHPNSSSGGVAQGEGAEREKGERSEGGEGGEHH